MDKKVVLTVCNGNIHRSVIAEICLDRELKKHGLENVVCISRGLESRLGEKCNMMHFPDEWAITEPILKELDIIVSPDRRAVQVDWETIEKASLILAMDRRVLRALWDRFPSSSFKMRLFSELVGKCEDIVDCKGDTNPETHRQANLRINEIVVNGYSFLRELVDWYSEEDKNLSEGI